MVLEVALGQESRVLRGLFSTLAVVLLVLEGEYWTGVSCDMVENNSNDNASEER